MTAVRVCACIRGMEEPEFDDLSFETTEFEPTEWDLAMSIGLRVDVESDREALDELADAMLVWAADSTLDPLTDEAMIRLWDDELEADIRTGLNRVGAIDAEWSAAASRAITDLDATRGRSQIAREVVRHLAMQLGNADQPLFACLCCIDDVLDTLEPGARRERARRAAILARRNAAVPADELRAAAGQAGATDPVLLLGTRERREAVRRRLARLGRLGSTSMPALSAELTEIGAEALPEPAEDDVWRELCSWMLVDAARPDLN